MSKSKKTNKPENMTGEALQGAVLNAINACIAKCSANEKSAATALQWARLAKSVTLSQCERIAQCEALQGALSGAVASLYDSERDECAPIYGAVKLWDTLRAVASGRAHDMSDLHCAYIAGLINGACDNASLNAYIARVTHKSASTAVTQRSSSAYALRSLGAIVDSGREQYPESESPVWGALQALLQ